MPSGGRKKGQLNRSTKKFAKALEALGFHVPDEMVKLFKETTDPATKLKIIDAIAKYAHAKPDPEVEKPEKPEDETEGLSPSELLEIAKK